MAQLAALAEHPELQVQEPDASGAQAPALPCTFSFTYAQLKASKKLKGNKNEE